jgi:hypothetical protein
MRFNAPSQALWIISVILGVLGIITHYRLIRIPSISAYSFELLVGGFVILVIATLVRRI